MIDPFLLEILACPNCDVRPPLRLEGEWLLCDACSRAYPILDDIPQLLPEDARPLSEIYLGKGTGVGACADHEERHLSQVLLFPDRARNGPGLDPQTRLIPMPFDPARSRKALQNQREASVGGLTQVGSLSC